MQTSPPFRVDRIGDVRSKYVKDFSVSSRYHVSLATTIVGLQYVPAPIVDFFPKLEFDVKSVLCSSFRRSSRRSLLSSVDESHKSHTTRTFSNHALCPSPKGKVTESRREENQRVPNRDARAPDGQGDPLELSSC